MSQQAEVPTVEELLAVIRDLNSRISSVERILLTPMGQQPEGQPPSVAVRLEALENAIQFTMQNIKVQIRQESPIIGGGTQTLNTNLLDFFLQQAKQQQMLVGQANGQQQPQ